MCRWIITRDCYSKPRVWISFRKNCEELKEELNGKTLSEYVKNALNDETFSRKAYRTALGDVAFCQLDDRYNSVDDFMKDFRPTYEYFKDLEKKGILK